VPRYFFDVRDSRREHFDTDGTVLDSVGHARREAIETLCEMAQESAPREIDRYELRIAVRGADGEPVLRVALTFDSDILGPRINPHP
jgi:hypothetical protein